MKIIQACAYSAPFEGNFIKSLAALEEKLRRCGYETIYVFPEEARERSWCKELERSHATYYLPTAKARIRPKTYAAFRRIYKEHPDVCIAHSHFELYDIPMTVTAPKSVKIFWHLHDSLTYEKARNGLRGMLWKAQYGFVGKRAMLISVSERYRNEVRKFGFPCEQTTLLPNGIDLQRIRESESQEKTFDFLTFGWDFYGKGGDLLLKAGNRLYDEGYRFRILYNGQKMTWNEMDRHLSGKECPFIERCDPTYDVNALFRKCKVFISASRAETFSYAIAEAAYAGLPVISSDIDGVQWAKALPTVDFFPSEDVEALCLQMKEHLDGKTHSADFVAISRKVIEANYSVDHWAEKIVETYGI